MRQLLNYSLVIALLLPLSTNAQNEPALSLSLEEAMDLAVKKNVQAKSARLNIEKQKAINNEITAIAYPQIKAKGEFNDYINPIQSFVPAEFIGGAPGTFVAVPFTPQYGATASATASQVIFDGSVLVALQARKAVLKLYDEMAQYTEEELRYNVHKAYYGVVVAEKQYETLKQTLQYIRKMGSETQATYDLGLIEQLDVDKIKVQVNNLVSDSITTGNIIEISKQLLKYQMNIDINTPIVLTDTSITDNIAEANSMLLEEVKYTNRTDYLLQKSKLELYQYDLKRHRFSGLPSLAAFGTAAYTYQTNTFSEMFNKPYIFYSLVGLQLNVPIFDGWARRSRVAQAKISIQQAEDSLDYLKSGIDFQAGQSRTTLKNALYSMENQERNFTLAMNILETTRKKYNAGVGSSTEVSQAQTEMLAAQGKYFEAMLATINAQSDLRKALGQFK